MVQHRQKARRRLTFFRCWWLRLFGLLLFVYGVNYFPVHLALETHLGDLPAQARSVGVEPSLLSAIGPAADSHHHPHLASDHSLPLATKAQVSFVSFVCYAPSATVEICRPQLLLPLFLAERQNPPGLPPPDPLQPRAPPLA